MRTGCTCCDRSLGAPLTHWAISCDYIRLRLAADRPAQTRARQRPDRLCDSQVLKIISSDSLLLIQSKGKTDPLQEAASSIESIVSKFKTKVGHSQCSVRYS